MYVRVWLHVYVCAHVYRLIACAWNSALFQYRQVPRTYGAVDTLRRTPDFAALNVRACVVINIHVAAYSFTYFPLPHRYLFFCK